MRTTFTIVMRLLVDENEPEAFRGMLREVTSGEEHAFSDEQSLLAFLHFMLNPAPGDETSNQDTPRKSRTGILAPDPGQALSQ